MEKIDVAVISAFRDYHNDYECSQNTLKVSELMDILKGMPEDAPVVISNDKGYTYGFLDKSRVRLRKFDVDKMEESSDYIARHYNLDNLSREERNRVRKSLVNIFWDSYCWMTGGHVESKRELADEVRQDKLSAVAQDMYDYMKENDGEDNITILLNVLKPYKKTSLKEDYSLEDAYEDRYAMEDNYEYDDRPSMNQILNWAIEDAFGENNLRAVQKFFYDHDIWDYVEPDGDEVCFSDWAVNEIADELGLEVDW